MVVAVAAAVLVLGGAARTGAAVPEALTVLSVDRASLLRASPSGVLPASLGPARAASTWCGTPTTQDQAPNAVAGNAIHWLYVVPSDGGDRLSTEASAMQTDAELIDSWWRGQDPTRAPRNDLTPLTCGMQLDLSDVRLTASGSQLDDDVRFDRIVAGIEAAGFRSPFVKYVVYFDGPVSDTNLCGQGGSDPAGFGVAVVYVRSCSGIAPSLVAAHELLHTLGAVPDAAPHNCPPPNDGHVCDSSSDIMYPFASPVPLSSMILDVGRDDYYGHSGSWLDVQDSAWLVQLDRQTPFALTVAGPGSVASDVPGLLCSSSCTTTWNTGTHLNLTATPASGAKLVRWGGACSGSGACGVSVAAGASASALFAPLTYRLSVSVGGKGRVVSSRAGISCPTRCSAAFPSYSSLRITTRPAKGWRFRAWTGACRGTAGVCTLPMSRNTSARAVFAKA